MELLCKFGRVKFASVKAITAINALKDDYTYYIDAEDILIKRDNIIQRLLWPTSPHGNPTGCKINGQAVELIVKENKDSAYSLLDEAYRVDFRNRTG